jgi:hypothetical protein
MMFDIFRFLKRGGRSATRSARQRQHRLRFSPYHHRLVCEPLETRALLSVAVAAGVAAEGPQPVRFAAYPALAGLPVAPRLATLSAAGNDVLSTLVSASAAAVRMSPHSDQSSAPIVSGVVPAAGPLSGGRTVTITGAGFTGATGVNFGAAAATNVVVVSDTQITATCPAESAGTVHVLVTSPAGVSAPSAADYYSYVAAPTVMSITPSAGPLAGGTSVTISGTGFTGATVVYFGTIAASIFQVESPTQITATSPAEAAATVNVTVVSPGGSSAVSSADRFTYQVAPTVTSINPSRGLAAGGTSVVITGAGFTGAAAVYFGTSAAASFVINSPTQITATSPAQPVGAVDVTVVGPGGVSALSPTDKYTYLTVPAVAGIAPTAGPLAGGTSVTITGSGFTGTTAVYFGTSLATNIVISSDATKITATSPARAAGTVHVTVTNPVGTSPTTGADQFTYMPSPVVASVNPTVGPAAGGSTVVIIGTSFSGATVVSFGSNVATSFVVNSSTRITATSPSEAIGTIHVVVTAPGGVSRTSTADQYTYLPAPVVASISPSQGPAAGGTSVVITGTGFSGTSVVTFGAIVATSFVVNSSTQITAVSPAGTAGPADITVTSLGGVSAASPVDQFNYLALPTVTGISPARGPLSGGDSVTITGGGFNAATDVRFGSLAATDVVVVSATRITATCPAEGAGTVDVTVTGPGGTSIASPADQFTFMVPPAVSSISPSSGPMSGGTTVTITGAGFTAATVVRFGATWAATFVVDSSTQITATSPSRSAGTVDLTVVGPGGVSMTSSADQFTFLFVSNSTPLVTGIAPSAGTVAGGTLVTIMGDGFSNVTEVKFGAIVATNFVVNSETQITATSPAEMAGAVDVTVTTLVGTSAVSSADQFTFTREATFVGLNSAGQWWKANSAGSNPAFQNWGGWSLDAGWSDMQVADVNGDGKADVVARTSWGDWYVARSTGTSFVSQSWGTWISSAGWHNVQAADVNGDGKVDIVGRASSGAWYVALSTGSSFVNQYWGVWDSRAIWQNVQIADVNGDGKADIIGRAVSGAWYAAISSGTSFVSQSWGEWNPAANWSNVRVADVNGDGKADVVGMTSSGAWYAAISTGTSFANQAWGAWAPGAGWSFVQVADVTGDGKADIVGMASSGAWYAAISTGAGFINQLWGQWNPSAGWQNVQVADTNGDGKADIAGITSWGSMYVSLSAGTSSVNQFLSNWWTPNSTWQTVMAGLFA